MSVHWVPKAGNRWWRVNTPGLEAFEGFLLTTCFLLTTWPSKDCCFMIRLPLEFRQSYVMAWAVGTVFYAWMLWCFVEKGCMQVCFMLCSLRPYICKQIDNKICQSTRGCPWVSFSVCGSPSLTNKYILKKISLSTGYNSSLISKLVRFYISHFCVYSWPIAEIVEFKP